MRALGGGDLRGAEHDHEVGHGRTDRHEQARRGDGGHQVSDDRLENGHDGADGHQDAEGAQQQPPALLGADGARDGEGEGGEFVAAVDEGAQGEGHADGGRGEAGVVAVVLAQPAGQQGRGEGADVDGHVEQLEAGVAPDVIVVVEAADDGRQVRLDEAGAHGHQHDPRPGEGGRGNGQADVARHDDDAAVEGGQPGPDDAVGEDAPGNGQEVDGHPVERDDDLSAGLAQAQAAAGHRVGDEVQQDGAHAVVGEALPHLHVEHPGQSAGVAEQPPVLPRRRRAQAAGPPPAGDEAAGPAELILSLVDRRRGG